MGTDLKWVELIARILMSAIFLFSGLEKLAGLPATQGYMAHYGIPGFLAWPAALFEIGAGGLLAAGFRVRATASLLAGWCLVTAAIFHHAFSDPSQAIMFLKDLALAGGLLSFASGENQTDGTRLIFTTKPARRLSGPKPEA